MSQDETVEARLARLGLQLPSAPVAMGLYRPVIVVGGLAYLSGHAPLQPDGQLVRGRLGADLDLAAGAHAARLTGLAVLASLQSHLGSLERVRSLVKTVGWVHATPDFKDHPAVLNGFSELMRDVFGPERGVGARSAVGADSLPGGIAVEIDVVFEVA
jgi:enamine deaminase RidA (YjgF/YER057c/UK114 family)